MLYRRCTNSFTRLRRGMCGAHYMRQLRHGDPQANVPLVRVVKGDSITRFNARVAIAQNGCHEWQGAKLKDGYGSFQFEYHGWPAHRWIWIRTNGPIPAGQVIRHKCDNPPCVKVDHLELGVVQDNADDMVARGRSLKGTKNAIAKLTDDDVRAIKAAIRDKSALQKDIAALYGVTPTLISFIKKGRAWSHINIEAA